MLFSQVEIKDQITFLLLGAVFARCEVYREIELWKTLLSTYTKRLASTHDTSVASALNGDLK